MPICCEWILLCSAVNFVSNTSLQRAFLPLPYPGVVCNVSLKVPQAAKYKQLLHLGMCRTYFLMNTYCNPEFDAFPPQRFTPYNVF